MSHRKIAAFVRHAKHQFGRPDDSTNQGEGRSNSGGPKESSMVPSLGTPSLGTGTPFLGTYLNIRRRIAGDAEKSRFRGDLSSARQEPEAYQASRFAKVPVARRVGERTPQGIFQQSLSRLVCYQPIRPVADRGTCNFPDP